MREFTLCLPGRTSGTVQVATQYRLLKYHFYWKQSIKRQRLHVFSAKSAKSLR